MLICDGRRYDCTSRSLARKYGKSIFNSNYTEEEDKISKKLLALLLAVVMVVGAIPVAAVAAGEGITITVGEEKSLVDAIGEANGTAAEAGTVTVVIPEGTFEPTANEQLAITRDNVTLSGAGVDSTVIDCGTYTCSDQGGIIIMADNVVVEKLTVKSAA